MISLAQIPEQLRHAHKKKEFLSHLRQLPAHRNDKKELLFAWAKMVGAILTPTEVDYATLHYRGLHGKT